MGDTEKSGEQNSSKSKETNHLVHDLISQKGKARPRDSEWFTEVTQQGRHELRSPASQSRAQRANWKNADGHARWKRGMSSVRALGQPPSGTSLVPSDLLNSSVSNSLLSKTRLLTCTGCLLQHQSGGLHLQMTFPQLHESPWAGVRPHGWMRELRAVGLPA